MAFKMKGSALYERGNQSTSPMTQKTEPTDAELEKMVNVNLPEVKVKAKKDKISMANPTKEELEKAKRRTDNKESDDGQTASMKVNETTGKREMVTVVSNTDKYSARKAAEKKVFDYNKANKDNEGYVRQTFKKNISKDNKYIS